MLCFQQNNRTKTIRWKTTALDNNTAGDELGPVNIMKEQFLKEHIYVCEFSSLYGSNNV